MILMSQESVSSELENKLLAEVSEGSVSPVDFVLEKVEKVLESQIPFQKLYKLNYSQELEDMEPAATFEQAQELPLPPSTPSEMWTEEERNTLQENRRYFVKMIEVVDKAEREGPQKLPKQPKKSLLHLFKEKEGKRESVKEMTHLELHTYLLANLADVGSTISRETFSGELFSQTCDEGEIVKRLQKGVKNVKKQDAQTMMIYIQFGNFLNLCKNWFDEERKKGRISQTWAQWLKEKCDYSEVHARKLRALAKVLFGYPQFFCVGPPVRYISGKLKQINSMLQVPEFREFWSSPLTLPTTQSLKASQ